ncbi:MAG: hypothetical protein DMG59_07330 [Acidobacteria bacterium]|nr:MAG: hypothetical protein DMG59_07330 [Acidobacteriota bacterium]
MNRQFHAPSTLAVLIAGLLLAPGPLGGQAAKAWTAPRTRDGHPDLQGIWTNNTLTPLERPAEFRSKPNVTEAEAAQYEKRVVEQRDRDRRDGDADTDVARAYNELFFDQGAKLARIHGTIRTSMVTDPPDGRIPPLTAEAQKRQQAFREYARLHPADRAQDRSLAERCLFWGTAGPPMLPGPYNNTYQVYQTQSYVMILVEMIHDARIIPLDGRPHVPPSVRQWMGDSRGRWEGEVLVVDTTNFSDKTRFRGSDENLHVTERFRRISENTILYQFTIDDPTAFTRPWTAELPLTATAGPIYEYACHEGNYALSSILAGARAEEKKAEGKPK